MPDNKDERISARLSEFLYELRHEVYTPLSVIKGYTELIGEKLEDTKDPEVKQYLQIIMKNIDRLEAFTEKILTIESLVESLKEEG